MRKLVAILCAVAMLIAFAAPAMANGSINGSYDPMVKDSVTIDSLDYTIVSTDKIDAAVKDPDVLKSIMKVNDPQESITVAQLDGALKPSKNDQYPVPSNLKDYHFTTGFHALVVTDSDIQSVGHPFTVTLVVPYLVPGVTYYIMFIDANGVVYYIPLLPDMVVNGTVDITFPDLGVFAIIEA